MSPRSRIAAFGSAAVLVAAGCACAALVSGVAGEVLTIVLISMGLGGALLLVFMEIGLGEDRDLARDEELRLRRERETPPRDPRRRALDSRRRPRLTQRQRRPD